MEISVPGTNPANPMFAHEDCSVGVMEEIAGQEGKVRKDLSSHLSVPRCWNQQTQSRRVEQARNEFPGLLYAPRPSHHPGMSGHAQELIEDRPTCVPGLRPAALAFQPRTRHRVKWRIGVGSIDQDIGIDDDQCLPALHGLIQRIPVSNINQGAAAVEDRQRR